MNPQRIRVEKISRPGQWLRVYLLYRTSFPRSERKPFGMILKMYRKGKTDVWCARDERGFAGFAATINDEAMTQLVRSAAQTLLGKEHVFPMKTPTMGSEDFGYYCQKAPGCYYGLGIANAEKGFTYPIHNPHFTVDPEALPYGAALYTQIAEDFLAEE